MEVDYRTAKMLGHKRQPGQGAAAVQDLSHVNARPAGHTRLLGRARITLRLVDIDGGGCRIEMAEMPVGALMTWIPNRLALAAAVPRY